MNKRLFILALTLLTSMHIHAQDLKKTIGLAEVKVTPSLLRTAQQNKSVQNVNTVAEAIDGHLITAITATRKFTVVERSDSLEELIKEQNLSDGGMVSQQGAESANLTGAQYLLTVTLDQFHESTETAVFDGVHRAKNRIVASAQMRIVDSSTSEVIEASNIQVNRTLITDVATVEGKATTSGRMALLIPEISRELAEKSTAKLVQTLFPAKVIDVDGTTVTINSGEGTFEVGDVLQLFGKSKVVTDPDTGARFTIKGRPAGKIKITFVEAMYSQGEIIDGKTATIGAIVSQQ